MNTATLPVEKKFWNGRPHQIINFNIYVLSIFFILIIIALPLPDIFKVLVVLPLLYSLWNYLTVKNTIYEATSQRLRITEGVLNRTIDELELYRIIDYRIEQPFFLRIFSLSNIILQTSDNTHAHLVLRAVPNGQALLDKIRFSVEQIKTVRGIREVNLNTNS